MTEIIKYVIVDKHGGYREVGGTNFDGVTPLPGAVVVVGGNSFLVESAPVVKRKELFEPYLMEAFVHYVTVSPFHRAPVKQHIPAPAPKPVGAPDFTDYAIRKLRQLSNTRCPCGAQHAKQLGQTVITNGVKVICDNCARKAPRELKRLLALGDAYGTLGDENTPFRIHFAKKMKVAEISKLLRESADEISKPHDGEFPEFPEVWSEECEAA